ncbi:hypothetical protein, partial [Mucilaginibacter sp.]|uniref:beta strand repeat-containing protein n=1 Tax=Mucilaginibacter sp. TaxID=1882438 RepID=UPI002ED290D0
MKTQLLCVLFAGYLLCLVNRVTAQEYYDGTNTPRQYYYNNLESATAGSPSTFLSSAGSTRNSSSTTIDLVSGSSLNSSKSLSSVGLSAIGYLRWNFMSSSASPAGLSLANNTWEWEFDYKNVTGATTADPAVTMTASTSSSTDSWRYWLIANAYTTNTSTDYTKGLYLTQAGGNLILRAKYGTANNQYTTYATISLPNSSTTTYQIRVVKSVIGYYYIYILNRSTNTTTTTGPVNVGTSVSGVDLNTYNYSYLESSTSASNRFQWDNFNFYQQKVDYVPITSAANGITTGPIYAGQSGIIPYGVNVNVRGDINFGRLRFNSSTNGQALFSSGTLYYTYNSVLSVSTAAGSITTTSFNSSNTQQMDVNQYYYSPGNTDGSTANVVNFFIVATTQNPFFTGYPSTISFSVSSAAADDFQSFYTSGYFPFSGASSTTGATITAGAVYDWTGASDSNWNNTANWSPATVPTGNNSARIGVNALTGNKSYPIISPGGATSVGNILFGTENSTTTTLAVNTPFAVSGNISVTSAIPSNVAYTLGLSGTSTLTVSGSLNIGDGVTLPSGNNATFAMNSTINQLNIAGNINLNSVISNGQRNFNATLNITSGIVSTSAVTTSNQAGNGSNSNTSTISVSGTGTLKLTAASALGSLSTVGTNVVSFNNSGATVEYSGDSQTVYTSSPITGLSGGVSYNNLKLSGTGTKTAGTASGGALTIGNDFTTSATTSLDTYNPTVTVGGNWSNSANVTQGSGNIAVTGNYTNTANTLKLGSGSMFVTGNFTNTAGTITGSTSTASLAISGALSNSGTITGNAQAIAVSGSATNNSIFTAGSGTVTIAGAYSNTSTGTFTVTTGIVNYNGDYSNTGIFTAGTGMVNFTKAGTQALFDNSTSGSTFNNVTVGNSGTKTMSASGT